MSNELSKALQLLTPKKNTDFFYGSLHDVFKNYFISKTEEMLK